MSFSQSRDCTVTDTKNTLLDYQRGFKLAIAIQMNSYNMICVCDTWLNKNILYSDFFVYDYTKIILTKSKCCQMIPTASP